ncbi:hypothetical protein [Pseudomonas vanderleydeniana]|uniref:Uncharacterized protein n=1 Tax=Pseudomonas vanderleydeniana TaxID=2745495 RepID=A0A9E6PGR0_9PSED|nr:hypothetical protein [Pseudomonas vanderleydeniana]QXI26163.1 hypothetical protein HU752_019605 [Pseudomonas vanderleydeniana]
MELFHFYSGSTLVGWSALEDGDPPMGVASGEFKPANGYAAIQVECQSSLRDQSSLCLSVRTVTGITIPCAGINISDYSKDLKDGSIEVSVLGVPHPLYEELFPNQVEIYAHHFD